MAVHRIHDGWPSASMKRVHSYHAHSAEWARMDYVYCIDVDFRWVAYAGSELLAPSLATLHADNAALRGAEQASPHVLLPPNAAPAASMWRQSSGPPSLPLLPPPHTLALPMPLRPQACGVRVPVQFRVNSFRSRTLLPLRRPPHSPAPLASPRKE